MHAGYPRPFGRYTLLAELGRGGMGEVYAATAPGGLPGIEKRCVIKTVHASATREREAVGRFLDEARLAVRLNQKNICSVFDVGVLDDGTYYLAMDLVRGRDLRTVWTRVGDDGGLMPPALAVHIIIEVLDGLHYAHELCDEAGASLHVVHRDVSPQNIMVSFDGDVKLIDFGLAASTMKLEQTQANIVMGKLGYLSPEQVRGERADARADVFSTAVVLYELLTGQRFYGAQTPGLRSERVASGRFEPALLGRLDDVMQGILRRALAGEREQRTATADRFASELRAWAKARDAQGDAAALRSFMRERFGTTREPWEQPSSPTPSPQLPSRRGGSPPAEATEIAPSPFPDVQTDEGSSTDERAIRTELYPRTRLVQPTTSEAPSLTAPRPAPAAPRRRVIAAGVVVGLVLGLVAIVAVRAVVGPAPPSDAGVVDVAPLPAPLAAPDPVAVGVLVAGDAGTAAPVDAGVVVVDVDAGVVAAASDVVIAGGVEAPPGAESAPARGERPRRRRDRETEAALARLDGAAQPGTPPVVQLKVIREVCGATACEATVDGALADRVAACLRSCRATVRRRAP